MLSIHEALERLFGPFHFEIRHPQVAHEHGTARIDSYSLLEELHCFLVMLLLEENVAQPPVSCEMQFIALYRLLITSASLFEIFITHILMPAESEGIGTALVQLDGPVEELDSDLMLLLKREGIAHRHPRRGKEKIHFDRHVSSLAEQNLLLELPETSRVILIAFDAVGFLAICFFEILLGFLILALLEVALSCAQQHPASSEVPFRKLLQIGEGFVTAQRA